MRPKPAVSYRVEVSPEARKEIRDLTGYVRAPVLQLIRELTETPRPARAQELKHRPSIYRIWVVGRWRVAYHVNDDLRRVRVLRVRLKEDIDYDSLGAPG